MVVKAIHSTTQNLVNFGMALNSSFAVLMTRKTSGF